MKQRKDIERKMIMCFDMQVTYQEAEDLISMESVHGVYVTHKSKPYDKRFFLGYDLETRGGDA